MEATAYGLGEDKDNTMRVAVKMLKGKSMLRHLKSRKDKNNEAFHCFFFLGNHLFYPYTNYVNVMIVEDIVCLQPTLTQMRGRL